jgi:5-methylcytosine-specific restriction endonuclease McrA
VTTRRPISRAARFAIWSEWDGACNWCRKPVRFADCEIDHLIPLDALEADNGPELAAQYALASDFDFDSFDNWVPTCPACNRRKGKVLLDGSPQLLLHLKVVRSKASNARKVAQRIQADQNKDKILGRLASAIEAGAVTEAEIEQFISDLPRIVRKAADLPDVRLYISPNWDVLRSGDGRFVRVVVSSSHVAGTAISSASSTFKL